MAWSEGCFQEAEWQSGQEAGLPHGATEFTPGSAFCQLCDLSKVS